MEGQPESPNMMRGIIILGLFGTEKIWQLILDGERVYGRQVGAVKLALCGGEKNSLTLRNI